MRKLTYCTFVCIFLSLIVSGLLQCGNATDLLSRKEDLLSRDPVQQGAFQLPNLSIDADQNLLNTENGTPFTARVTIRNNTSIPETMPFYITLIMRDVNGTESFLNSWSLSGMTAESENVLLTSSTIPSLTLPGSYQLYFRADTVNQVQESNESDNERGPFGLGVAARTQLTDLQPVNLNWNTAGGTVNFDVLNAGPGVLHPEVFFYDVYISSNNAILDSADTLVHSGDNFRNGSRVSLGVNETMAVSFSHSAALPAGNHTLIIVIDSQSNLPEADENNNRLSQTRSFP